MLVRLIGVFVIIVMAAACEITAEKPEFDDIRFTDQKPLRLDVAAVEILNRYRAPRTEPNVEHRFPITPQQTLINWARDRLIAVGDDGAATFIIEDASVIETKLAKKTGFRAFFTSQQTARYDGRLRITLRLEKNGRRSEIQAEANHSRTAAEHISLNDRDRIFYQLTREMIVTLDQEIDIKAKQHLLDFLR